MVERMDTQQLVVSVAELDSFKDDYYRCDKGKHNLEAQVPHLKRLAISYEDAYQRTRKWRYALQAHGLFLALHTREPENEEWKQAAFRIQQAYWSGHVTTTLSNQDKITDELKQILKDIRESTVDGLNSLDHVIDQLVEEPSFKQGKAFNKFYEEVRNLSTCCTEEMIGLVKKVMHESVIMLSEPPPCSFSSVVIGSLARREATPYSDVEYLFLIEDNKPSTIEYFERLAMTTYFLFNNLGETPLKYFSIDELQGWFDDQAANGVKIDGLSKGAGNIPTGNGSSNKKNKFILTVDELFEDYKTVLDNPTEESLRGDLTAMLLYMREVYSSGEPGLLEKFLIKVAECERNETRTEADKAMIIGDVRKFSYMPNAEWRNGYTLNVKQDLFRFPSIVLYDLSIIFNIRGESTWDTLQRLHAEGKLSFSVMSALKMLSATASYIRLKTYNHFRQHNDAVSILEPVPETQTCEMNTDCVHPAQIQPRLFFKLCESLMSLKIHMKVHIENIVASLSSELNQPVDLIMALVYCNCSEFQLAAEKFAEFFGVDVCNDHNILIVCELLRKKTDENDELMFEALNILGWTLYRCDKFKMALDYFQLVRNKLDKDTTLYLRVLNGLGLCLSSLDRHKEAAALYEQILLSHTLQPEIEGIMKANYGLTIAFSSQDYDRAMGKCIEALQIFYSCSNQPAMFDYYGYQIHSDVSFVLGKLADDELIRHLSTPSFNQAWCLRCIAVVLKEQRQYLRALRFLETSLRMHHSIHKQYSYDYFLRKIASELAEDYLNLDDFENAVEIYKKMLCASFNLYGKDSDNQVTASLLCSVGSTLTKLSRSEEAESHLFKSIQMYHRLLGDTPDLQVAKVLRCIGNNYHASDEFDKALQYYQNSLQMYKEVLHSSNDKRDIAMVMIDIGVTNIPLQKFEEAHAQLKSAQEILEAFYGIQAPQKPIGEVYCSIGKAYLMQGNRIEAKKNFDIALNAYRHVYQFVEPEHPSITYITTLYQPVNNF